MANNIKYLRNPVSQLPVTCFRSTCAQLRPWSTQTPAAIMDSVPVNIALQYTDRVSRTRERLSQTNRRPWVFALFHRDIVAAREWICVNSRWQNYSLFVSCPLKRGTPVENYASRDFMPGYCLAFAVCRIDDFFNLDAAYATLFQCAREKRINKNFASQCLDS